MHLRISTLPNSLVVARLAPDAPLPSWIQGTFTSVTRTKHELSIVCDAEAVPDDVQAERDWRALMVEGPIPFEMTGVAAALVTPLAEARISVFVIATYDTDYVMVRANVLESAIAALRGAGFEVA